MISRFLFISILAWNGIAYALEPMNPPGLLPLETARSLIEHDPGVAAAHAGLEVALQEAGILDQSPYEWVTQFAGQRRRLNTGSNYNEWSVGIERTIRLPGKASADRSIGKATVNESEARYGEAIQEAARELMALWLESVVADQSLALAVNSLQSLHDSLSAVEKRVRAGDASKLDLNIARAELADQKRINNDIKTKAEVAWSRLSTRFPSITRTNTAVPQPSAIEQDLNFWLTRIMAVSDELKIMQIKMQIAQAQADRANADKIPDPTLGLHTGSESGGQERITGVVLSIPISGGLRNSRSVKALAEVEVLRHEVELKKLELKALVASNFTKARGDYESLQIANEGAMAMQENADLVQRAYELGEAELQLLLLARRQAASARQNGLQAQEAALKSYYGLIVDAHLVWGLEHN